jgi:hypothetical protein
MTIWLHVLTALAPVAGQEAPEPLTWERFEEVQAHVLPSAEEERWLRIPWRSRLWDAVEEAREAGKPILLWAMNGHPLGCV